MWEDTEAKVVCDPSYQLVSGGGAVRCESSDDGPVKWSTIPKCRMGMKFSDCEKIKRGKSLQ